MKLFVFLFAIIVIIVLATASSFRGLGLYSDHYDPKLNSYGYSGIFKPEYGLYQPGVYGAQSVYPSHLNPFFNFWNGLKYGYGDFKGYQGGFDKYKGFEPYQNKGYEGFGAYEPFESKGYQGYASYEPYQYRGYEGFGAYKPYAVNGVYNYGPYVSSYDYKGFPYTDDKYENEFSYPSSHKALFDQDLPKYAYSADSQGYSSYYPYRTGYPFLNIFNKDFNGAYPSYYPEYLNKVREAGVFKTIFSSNY